MIHQFGIPETHLASGWIEWTIDCVEVAEFLFLEGLFEFFSGHAIASSDVEFLFQFFV